MNFESFRESKTGTLKKLEKASALSASDKPEDQDRAREYRVAADFKSWRNQKRSGKLKEGGIPKQSKPNEPYDGGKPVEEEVGISSTEKMQKAMKDAQLKKKEDEAVAKAKQPTKKASKEGIRTKIAGAVKKGVERHKSAVKKSKFASGVKSGVKSVGKFIRDVDSVLKVNKKTTVNMQSYEPELPMIDELNRYGKETGKATGSLNKRPGSPVKGNKNEPASAVSSVRRSIRRETGRPEGQQKKKRGAKVDPKAYGQPETSVQRIKKYLEKKRAAQADPSQGRYPPGSRKD